MDFLDHYISPSILYVYVCVYYCVYMCMYVYYYYHMSTNHLWHRNRAIYLNEIYFLVSKRNNKYSQWTCNYVSNYQSDPDQPANVLYAQLYIYVCM